MSASIQEALRVSDNDYSAQAHTFAVATGGQDLVFGGPWRANGAEKPHGSVSVVIATYNGHRTLPVTLAALSRQRHRDFEVIIVDDGSTFPLKAVVLKAGLDVPVTLVRLPDNGGLSRARNIGIQCAQGSSLIFMDDDMLVSDDLTGFLASRQSHTEGCVLVGFREDVHDDRFFGPPGPPPQPERDWRMHSNAVGECLLLAADQDAPRTARTEFRLVQESSHFREFGRGRVIGFWDLPCMVTGHSICVKRSDVVSAGGFAEGWFSGWGIEDLAFGALMAARGHFVVPTLSWSSFHLQHEGRKVSRAEEQRQMRHNFSRYLEYIREPVRGRKLPRHPVRRVLESAGLTVGELVG